MTDESDTAYKAGQPVQAFMPNGTWTEATIAKPFKNGWCQVRVSGFRHPLARSSTEVRRNGELVT